MLHAYRSRVCICALKEKVVQVKPKDHAGKHVCISHGDLVPVRNIAFVQ